MSFCVGDELYRYIVYARIIGERSCRELRQLLVITTGQARPDFTYVLLNYVSVVEQPFACRADIESALRRCVESIAYIRKNPARVIEPLEQRPRSPLFFSWRNELVLSRDVARMLREAVVAEHLSADRRNELSVVGGVVAFEKRL